MPDLEDFLSRFSKSTPQSNDESQSNLHDYTDRIQQETSNLDQIQDTLQKGLDFSLLTDFFGGNTRQSPDTSQQNSHKSSNSQVTETSREAELRSLAESREDSLRDRIKSIATREAEIQQRSQSLENREAEFNRKIENLSSREAEIKQQSQSLENRESELNRKIENLSSREAELKRRTESLATQATELKIQTDKLKIRETELSRQSHTLATRETELQRLAESVSEIKVSQENQISEQERPTSKNYRLKRIWLGLVLISGVGGFVIGKTDLTFSQSLQLPSSLSLPGAIDTSADRTVADFQTAQVLAREAAEMSQNPPHPLSVWREIEGKWQKAVEILVSIPEDSPIASQAQEKLNSYQANYSAIANRIVTEEQAAKNLEKANQLAQEAASLTHSQETQKTAQAKLQEAIGLLQAIPQGTFVKAQAQAKLAEYQAMGGF
ncbi:hypothetical protein H6G20_00120 [Desertifilum sp. FACHB-1129]|uniref:Uncharacterized protein n=2 Tax=Desertifilum tharense IPPAS B-1220 TaxID=1781255 RepID=A0A1E5QJK0_9CYAN|nr:MULTISPECIES: hypothetical protein [Desertifilum]MDA0211562.1 hypothetical protein [Cyanobacteria bacterium FC1]MBD2310086.1 hypothetical protein [Desertifilum sp. FACHB-1129]MBD2322110.1 hypothetical protein [Desertifilum sp. FACHB-866]MBD2333811.1 hypothetical protein [Desertifilum sp. FACHB-868]OEJ74771.1 hypothetical protein BH720_12905 [Desertifilum tharense IPPAS B-1220]